MAKEIQAKVMLSNVRQPDDWFGLKYNMNLYRGCQHRCIYCDSRSECYGIDNFDSDVLIKSNAIDLLENELASKRVKGTIGTGFMHDPYMPLEEQVNLTGRALEVIAAFGFPVHLMTKSDMVLRDLNKLCKISRVYAAVSFTITTADDELGRKLEPGAPLVSRRLHAMKVLAGHGIYTGITMMPILPFIEDNEENIQRIVELAHAHGASYIIPWFGMSLRDRQRAYYYARLDDLFPGLKAMYQASYGQRYICPAPNASHLKQVFDDLCSKYSISQQIETYQSKLAKQLPLL